MFRLDNKKALVTGASGAIGAAIAQTLSELGCYIYLTGRNQERLNKVKANISQATTIPIDLEEKGAIEHLLQTTGPIDILVNNAGITLNSLALRVKDEDWQHVIDTNLTTPFKLIRTYLKDMMKQRWGRIINIGSIVGSTGNPGQASYCASKAGLIGMSKSLAQEVASRGITVNCVAPGFIHSQMTAELPENLQEKYLQSIPCGRYGDGKDIASAVAFLASEEANYITGQTLHVNGGMAML